MPELIQPAAEWCAIIVEAIGIGILTFTAIYVLFYAAFKFIKREDFDVIFKKIRIDLGRGILLGLEFLVAADIIETVAVDLSFYTVGVLAVVVLIRTFLSFTLEVELTGKWPWQNEIEEEVPL